MNPAVKPCEDCKHTHVTGECKVAVGFSLKTIPARMRLCGCPHHRVGDTVVRRGADGSFQFISLKALARLRLPDDTES